MPDLDPAFAADWRYCAVAPHDASWVAVGARAHVRHPGRDRWTLYGLVEGRHAVRTPRGPLLAVAPAAYLVPPRLPVEDDVIRDRAQRRLFSTGFAVLVPPGWSDPLLRLDVPMAVPVRDGRRFASTIAELLACCEPGVADPDRLILGRIALDRLLLDHLRDGFAAGIYRLTADAGCPPWLAQLAATMIHRYQQRRFSIADLASTAGVSASHLTRLFRTHLGLSPLRHLRRERVRLGLRLLANASAGSVAEAAARVGYSDPRLFWRHCIAETGHPPSRARPGKHTPITP